MNDEQLLRYSRQIMLPQFDIEGQERLLNSHAIIVGLGGLGSPVAMYLASAGVGHLTLVDFDNVDLSNIQRQILHGTPDIGKPKTQSALETLQKINQDIKISLVNELITKTSGNNTFFDIIRKANVVIDATDNFSSRFLLNDLCVSANVPLVSGAAIRMEGQVCVFLNNNQGGPCYRCLYRDDVNDQAETCSETGILSPVAGIIGSIQAVEALKVIAQVGETLNNRVLLLDAMTMEWRSLKLNKDPACPICNK
ncbi:MAG: molybdopterin-synthase adenylyltransferase MoeB [Gammaproteobacteria bacterium]|nr:molybdopterin-synthase adenylyltransferase MoeB [Gammaproteobacteria bacterium]